jgi:DNA-binding PadR family transcriptional regulator
MVREHNNSSLHFAILGLLGQQPRSGYDLRKFFSNTPLISFSDSPGAIYPALHRLEKRGLVSGTVDESPGRRGRTVFTLTPRGRTQFLRWQRQPITRHDIIRNLAGLMLRFAFMDQLAGKNSAVRFLTALREELATYLPSLRQYFDSHQKFMPLSGKLALACGIQEYETRLRWTTSALRAYHHTTRGASK